MSKREFTIATALAIFIATGYGITRLIDKSSILELRNTVTGFMKSPAKFFEPHERTILAQKHAGKDPHGDDPHGDDPHDEIHDPDLPANKERSFGKAPKDVYGGTVPNDQKPY